MIKMKEKDEQILRFLSLSTSLPWLKTNTCKSKHKISWSIREDIDNLQAATEISGVNEISEQQRHRHQHICNPLVNRRPWKQNNRCSMPLLLFHCQCSLINHKIHSQSHRIYKERTFDIFRFTINKRDGRKIYHHWWGWERELKPECQFEHDQEQEAR